MNSRMSKRARKVAFDEEVELSEKRRKEEEFYESEEKRECALIGIHVYYTPEICNQQSLASKLSTLWIAMKKTTQIQYRRVALEMKIWQLKRTQPL